MVICFLLNFADFSLIEIIISYRRFWSFVMGSYPGSWDSVSLRSFVNRTKRPSETRLSQVANISQTGTAVYKNVFFDPWAENGPTYSWWKLGVLSTPYDLPKKLYMPQSPGGEVPPLAPGL